MAKKIGIYGGSFDPIHFGHLNLAIGIMEARHLDEIWFCPSALNPFKPHSMASSVHRLNMLKLAIEGNPSWKFSDVEINRPGPSYTIDTLIALHDSQKAKKINDQFYLIIGDDAAHSFYRWHRAEEILNYATLLVGKRNPEDLVLESFSGNAAIVDAIKKGLTSTKVMEISSTDIRQRLKNRLYCDHLIPGKVLDYISRHSLYLFPE